MKTTHTSFCIAFVCGAPGSGKSYTSTRDVIDRLKNDAKVVIRTNLPLNVAEIAQHVAAHRGCEAAEVIEQVRLIDRDELRRWADGAAGPWDFASKGQAEGAELLLDECHIYCSKRQKVRHITWEKWLGEARHEGWRRIVFITQDESKVGQPIKDHAELRFELTNSERRRDPILQIPLTYWYELVASFTGEYRASIAVTEYRRVAGRLRPQHTERVPLDPAWFKFYRSYEAAGGGTGRGHGSAGIVREFQKRPKLWPKVVEGKRVAPTWLWFLKRFAMRFAGAAVMVCAVFWLVAMGGMSTLINGWVSHITRMTGAAPAEATQEADPAAVVSAEPPKPIKSLRDVVVALSEEDREVILEEMRKNAREVQNAQAQTEAIQQERDNERRRHTVVALTDDQVWFTDPPCTCKIGKPMSEGPYMGLVVRQISVDEGWVEMDNGVQLWVGRQYPGRLPDDGGQDRPDVPAAAGNDSRSKPRRPGEVQGPVSAPPAEEAGPELAAPVLGANHDLGAGDDAPGLRPQSGLRSILVSRDGGGTRRQAADAGDPRPANR
jgi:hypothetical protein